MKDIIVEKVRKIRTAHAAKFHFNIDEIIKDLREKQKLSNQNVVSNKDGVFVSIKQ